jgi:hypothetical protein
MPARVVRWRDIVHVCAQPQSVFFNPVQLIVLAALPLEAAGQTPSDGAIVRVDHRAPAACLQRLSGGAPLCTPVVGHLQCVFLNPVQLIVLPFCLRLLSGPPPVVQIRKRCAAMVMGATVRKSPFLTIGAGYQALIHNTSRSFAVQAAECMPKLHYGNMPQVAVIRAAEGHRGRAHATGKCDMLQEQAAADCPQPLQPRGAMLLAAGRRIGTR